MSATYIPIQSTTLTTSAASVTFSNIPQTYTDLVLKISARTNQAQDFAGVPLRFNGATTNANMSGTWLVNNGKSAVLSFRNDTVLQVNGATTTNVTFANAEIYFPNYTSSTSKVYSVNYVIEKNDSSGFELAAVAGLFSNTAALTQIQLLGAGNFVADSTFHLYGISNA